MANFLAIVPTVCDAVCKGNYEQIVIPLGRIANYGYSPHILATR